MKNIVLLLTLVSLNCHANYFVNLPASEWSVYASLTYLDGPATVYMGTAEDTTKVLEIRYDSVTSLCGYREYLGWYSSLISTGMLTSDFKYYGTGVAGEMWDIPTELNEWSAVLTNNLNASITPSGDITVTPYVVPEPSTNVFFLSNPESIHPQTGVEPFLLFTLGLLCVTCFSYLLRSLLY